VVKLFVGLTDLDWFNYLSARPALEELNFWQPSGPTIPRAARGRAVPLQAAQLEDFIVGGGIIAQPSRVAL
jgi:putative restriction endonuclease